MKKKMLLVLSVLLFAGLMWYNLQQAEMQRNFDVPEISMLQLDSSPMMANAETSGCVADDPGECVAGCDGGTPCCVGLSPNCTEYAPWGPVMEFDCGYGATNC